MVVEAPVVIGVRRLHHLSYLVPTRCIVHSVSIAVTGALPVGGTFERPDLFIAILAAGDDDIFGVDIFAEPRKLIGSDLVAASYDRSPAFYLRRHLSVGNDLAVGILDEKATSTHVFWRILELPLAEPQKENSYQLSFLAEHTATVPEPDPQG